MGDKDVLDAVHYLIILILPWRVEVRRWGNSRDFVRERYTKGRDLESPLEKVARGGARGVGCGREGAGEGRGEGARIIDGTV